MLKTSDGRELDVVKLSWEELNTLLHPVLPEFLKIMEAFDNEDFSFYKASYPFGTRIIQGGKCYLPLKTGESISLDNEDLLPEELFTNLNFNPETEDPLALIVNKNSEFYLETGARIMSHAMIHPGEFFGIPRALEKADSLRHSGSALNLNLNAGARYLFTLSKVSAKNRHEKLQKTYGIRSNVPTLPEEQWVIFKELARATKSPWRCEVVFFPRKWINELKNTQWAALSNHLIQIHRASYNVWHNTSLIWSATFSEIEQKKRLGHFSIYSLFTARQLFLIAANSAIGFKPATNDNSAPIKFFQEAYANGYGLAEDDHSNIIMEPSNFVPNRSEAVYYSLNYPMLAQYNPETFKGKSLITLLDEIQFVAKAYQDAIIESYSNIKSLYDVATSTKFSFYHPSNEQQTYKNILSNLLIKEDDVRFVEGQRGEFPEHSSFFKGCIKIEFKAK